MLPIDTTAAQNIALSPEVQNDAEVALVHAELLRLDPTGNRFAVVLRDTIDQLLNGEVTGRYDWKTLFKTEKTHAGTLVEINLQREFRFTDGLIMDYRIAGIEVDCKYSQKFGSWMIPPEAVGHLCLLVWADDYKSQWSSGLFRVRQEWLNPGGNRDSKLTVAAEHRRDKIMWLWRDAKLPENVLLHMRPQDRDAVFASKYGQQRLNELFRRVQQRPIGRNVVRTVAQQKDYMKRVRGNGGSRSALRPEGILIMGDYDSHRAVAVQLGLQAPREGEFVSVRVARAMPHHHGPSCSLDGHEWVVAGENDPVETAPALPAHTFIS
ncbi:NaeI family type II restriction endonuclease [Streptomyces sp. AN091965]|uniref:NaeI family type II restriction endonuclease n=1 Tax=Streptomyces sp. AN091965 TaxID=2927803 RepID=UPI001F60EBC9|nr:NaeI family type II restriction endonuclease [Streptomyces sp. AN091965]MCI3930923.1 NaeI family type II restriction endonuclease [Streptomyces sp. AN091965]